MYQYYEIRPRVFAIQDRTVRMYLVCGSKRAMLIDTGYGSGNVLECIRTFCTKPIFVVHTHTHMDHIGCDALFDDIYVAAEERENLLKQGIPASHLRALRDGDRFDLGDRTIVAHKAPGHTAGSTMFSDFENRLLFTGDNVADVTVYLSMPGADIAAYTNTLHWILAHQSDYEVFLGCHGMAEQTPTNAENLLSCVQNINSGKGTWETVNAYGDVFFLRFSDSDASVYLPLDYPIP